jgi:hypothetical protein
MVFYKLKKQKKKIREGKAIFHTHEGMEARKEEEPTGGLQPSFGLEVENLLKAIDAVERLLHEAGEPGAVKLVEASNQIKQITATIQVASLSCAL